MPYIYETMKAFSNIYSEKNDCAVISVAIVTDSNYTDTHRLFERLGRKKGGSTNMPNIIRAVNKRGYKLVCIDKYINKIKKMKGSGVTTCTISRYLDNDKAYLVGTSGHIAAFKEGELHDWSSNRKLRVIELWEAVKVK